MATPVEDLLLFVRRFGRVQGPYNFPQLCKLVGRAQLARHDHVSPDGKEWKVASDYPELFQRRPNTLPVVEAEGPEGDGGGLGDQSEATEETWYYTVNDAQQGPVSLEHLKALLVAGSLAGRDLVWTDGMTDWVPADKVLGPVPLTAAHTTADDRRSSNGGLSRTLRESMPWVSFIVIAAGFLSACCLVGGICAAVIGLREHRDPQVAAGLSMFVYSAVVFFFARLLFAYNRDVSKYLQDSEKSPRKLDRALRALRTFWVFNSVVLIVCIVLGIITVIWVLSVS